MGKTSNLEFAELYRVYVLMIYNLGVGDVDNYRYLNKEVFGPIKEEILGYGKDLKESELENLSILYEKGRNILTKGLYHRTHKFGSYSPKEVVNKLTNAITLLDLIKDEHRNLEHIIKEEGVLGRQILLKTINKVKIEAGPKSLFI